MGVLHVGVDVGAGDAEVDVIYVSFIVSVQHIVSEFEVLTILQTGGDVRVA